MYILVLDFDPQADGWWCPWGKPHMKWMNTIVKDLQYLGLSLAEAIPITLDRHRWKVLVNLLHLNFLKKTAVFNWFLQFSSGPLLFLSLYLSLSLLHTFTHTNICFFFNCSPFLWKLTSVSFNFVMHKYLCLQTIWMFSLQHYLF